VKSIQFFVNVIKTILTRCQIFHLKCTKNSLHPDPAGELTALSRPSSWIWEKWKGKDKGKRTEKRREINKGGEGRE